MAAPNLGRGPQNSETSSDNVVGLEHPGQIVVSRRTREKRKKIEVDHEESWLISYADMMTLLVGFFVMIQSFSQIDAEKLEMIKKETTRVFGGEYKLPYEKLSQKLQEMVKKENLSDQVFFIETEAGIAITFRGALFFDSGAADLRPEATNLLNKIIPVVAEQAKDFGIVVEGHTDNVPIVSKMFASNWELSSIRACTVLRMFEEKGFNRDKIKAIGFGDTHPVLPNVDAEGKSLADNQAQNRRVIIRILRHFESQKN